MDRTADVFWLYHSSRSAMSISRLYAPGKFHSGLVTGNRTSWYVAQTSRFTRDGSILGKPTSASNVALNDTYRDLYRLAHGIAPNKGIGWHVWHNNSFSPFYRAEQDYGDFQHYSDFLKVVIYNLCGGERLAQYVRSVQRTIFADLTPAQVLDFTYGVQQYRDKPLDELAKEGLGPDYVLRETKRAVAGAGPNMKIWPGIDVDIPTAPTSKKTTPEDVYLAVKAAFDGGAHGVLLSRKYSEMRLDNIRGAGRAIRELKVG